MDFALTQKGAFLYYSSHSKMFRMIFITQQCIFVDFLGFFLVKLYEILRNSSTPMYHINKFANRWLHFGFTLVNIWYWSDISKKTHEIFIKWKKSMKFDIFCKCFIWTFEWQNPQNFMLGYQTSACLLSFSESTIVPHPFKEFERMKWKFNKNTIFTWPFFKG